MVTRNQLLKGMRTRKHRKANRRCTVPALEGNCFKKGICIRVYTVSPRKPNSGVRKVAKVLLNTRRRVIVGIPGSGHMLQVHNHVVIRGGRFNDVPGIRYKMVRGLGDFYGLESIVRNQKRSKYGVKKK